MESQRQGININSRKRGIRNTERSRIKWQAREHRSNGKKKKLFKRCNLLKGLFEIIGLLILYFNTFFTNFRVSV